MMHEILAGGEALGLITTTCIKYEVVALLRLVISWGGLKKENLKYLSKVVHRTVALDL